MARMLKVIHGLYIASLRPCARRFVNALCAPDRVQQECLNRILKRNNNCEYLRRFNVKPGVSAKFYQKNVPIVTYDELSPWIERITQGEKNVLTSEPILMVEPTGGSSTMNKYIPYTRSLLSEYAAATNPWIYRAYQQHSLRGTTSYWSLSMARHGERRTSGGIRIGFENDTEYFNPIERWALSMMMSVPGSIAHAKDFDEWRWLTAKALMMDRNLGLISVWSPTFLIELMKYIDRNIFELIRALPTSRQREIRKIQDCGKLDVNILWPKLQLISCWTDGLSSQFISSLHRWFPGVRIQGKGLLATEGVVSVPLSMPTGTSIGNYGECVAAITSHFLEFIDLEQPTTQPLLAHELRR